MYIIGADGLAVEQRVRIPKVFGSSPWVKSSVSSKCHQCEFVSKTHCAMQP